MLNWNAMRRPQAFTWSSLFADGTPGFRINVEEAIRLNQQALGPELVTNGDFSDGTTGWTPASNASLSVTAGVLRVTNVGANYGYAWAQLATTAGKTYLVRTRKVGQPEGVNNNNNIHIGTGPYPSGDSAIYRIAANKTAGVDFIFYATQATTYIGLNAHSNVDGGWMEYDNISVREIDLSKCVAFQDSAGTLPVTAMEQPLGLILDTKLGLPVLGPELFPPSQLQTTSGWITVNDGTIAVVTDGLQLTANGSEYAGCRYDLDAPGKAFQIEMRYTAATPGLNIAFNVADAAQVTELVSAAVRTTSGVLRFIAVMDGISRVIPRIEPTTGSIVINSISVREIPGNHFIQPNNAPSRPIVSRRVNLLESTEDFSSLYWTKGGSSIGSDQIDPPFGSGSVKVITENTDTSQHVVYRGITLPAGTYTLRGFFKQSTHGRDGYLRIRQSVSAGDVYASAIFVLSGEGSVTSVTGSATIRAVGGGWYECSITGQVPAGTATVIAGAANGTDTFYAGDGTSGIYIWGADLRLSIDSNLPPYQRVTSPTDYDEVGFPAYARFDGLDDWLESGVVDMTSTDEVTVLAGVAKLSDAAASIILEYSASIAVNDGAFYLSGTVNQSDTRYRFASKGTIGVVLSSTAAPAPLKMLVSGAADISTPISTLRRDGVAVATTSDSQGTGNYGNHKFYMGRRGGTSFPFNGRVYGITVIGKLLPDNQLAAAEHAERQLGRLY